MNNTEINEEKVQEKQDVTETKEAVSAEEAGEPKAGCSCCGGRKEKKQLSQREDGGDALAELRRLL